MVILCGSLCQCIKKIIKIKWDSHEKDVMCNISSLTARRQQVAHTGPLTVDWLFAKRARRKSLISHVFIFKTHACMLVHTSSHVCVYPKEWGGVEGGGVVKQWLHRAETLRPPNSWSLWLCSLHYSGALPSICSSKEVTLMQDFNDKSCRCASRQSSVGSGAQGEEAWAELQHGANYG